MIGFVPKRPSGSSPEARFAQWVFDELMQRRPQQTPDSKTLVTTRGVASIVKPGVSGGTGAAEPVVQLMKIAGLAVYDFVICNAWNGVGWNQGPTLVAKYHHMRPSAVEETVDGVEFDYTYVDDNNRISNDGTNAEHQVAYPRYAVGSIFVACLTVTGTGVANQGTDVGWIEWGTRVWARRYIQ